MAFNIEDARKRRIETTLEYRAPIERVFKAFTDAADLSEWLHAGYESDPKKGGKFKFGGNDIGGMRHGEYLTVDAPKLLVFSWRWNMLNEDTGDMEPSVTDKMPTKVTVEFSRGPETTRVKLVHDGFTEVDESYCGYALGWDMLAGTYLTYFLENGKEATDAWWEKEGPIVQEKFEKDFGAAMGAISAGLD